MTATFPLLFIIPVATLTTVCYMKAVESLLLNNVSFERYLPKTQQKLNSLLEEELKELRRTIKLSALAPNSSAIAQCLKCTKAVILAVRAAFVSGNNFERFLNICDRIRGMLQCISRIRGKCFNTREVETLTDSFRYLCKDQFHAYKHIVECLDVHSAASSLSCSKDCHLNRYLLGWFFYGYTRDMMLFTVPDDETPAKVNVPYFRRVSTDACKMYICYLGCIKESYNAKCEGFGGSLLLEALLRPLLSLHKSWAFSPITNMLRLLLPSQCNIITTEKGLNYFRLSEEADFNLKQWFSGDLTHKYSNLSQSHNLSRNLLQLSLSRSAASSLRNQEQLPNSNLRTSGDWRNLPEFPRIHTEDTEKVIQMLKEVDRRQQLKLP